MSNIYLLPTPQSPRPPREMTNDERDHLTRAIKKIANAQYYPLSRLLMRLSIIVEEYPLEEVTLKDLSPKGFLISADYPTYGLHWVFRLEGQAGKALGKPVSQLDLLPPLQKAVKGIGSPEHSVRFCYRFLNDLGDKLRVHSIEHDKRAVLAVGSIQSTPFALDGTHRYLPFRMTLAKP